MAAKDSTRIPPLNLYPAYTGATSSSPCRRWSSAATLTIRSSALFTMRSSDWFGAVSMKLSIAPTSARNR
jgi:hypothetical protein